MFETNPISDIHIQKCYDHYKYNDHGYVWRKVFIVDNFYKNPDEVAELASSHTPSYDKKVCSGLIGGRVWEDNSEMIKNLNLALKTIQPQTLYRATGDPKWRNIRGANTTDPTKMVNLEDGGQGLYQFLLDESVVNSSATYRDVLGLLKDIQKGGDFLTRVFDKFGKRSKGLIKWSQDMYIAEDDIWKVFNFLGESYKMNRGSFSISLSSINVIFRNCRHYIATKPQLYHSLDSRKTSKLSVSTHWVINFKHKRRD